MKKKILITGAAGFLGQLAIEYYKKKYDLILVDRYKLKHKNFHSIDITDYNSISISWIIISFFFEICDIGTK